MKAMDETKLNLDTGGIDTTDDSKRSVSLGQQAFDVLKGVVIGEMVKKNGKLRRNNQKLSPIGKMQLCLEHATLCCAVPVVFPCLHQAK